MSDSPQLVHPVDSADSGQAFARVFGGASGATQGIKPVPVGTKRWKKALFIVSGILLLLIAVGGVVGFFGYTKVMALKGRADELKVAGKDAYDALKSQNLVLANTKLADVHTKMDALSAEYNSVSWLGVVPVAGAYYKDGQHGLNAGYAGLHAAQTLLSAIEPNAARLGFQRQGPYSGGTAADLITKLIPTLHKYKT